MQTISTICSISTLLLLFGLGTTSSRSLPNAFTLSIIHVNDLHARFDEINAAGDHCRPTDRLNCFGGYARLVTTVRRLQNERVNSIYLNAGDNFQGTFWYNVGKWNVTAQILNLLPADAIALGNHEFDDGIDGLVPFISALKSPVLMANVDDQKEPRMHGIYKPSLVIDRFGRKVGIIGLIVSTLDPIAIIVGRLRFLDEVKTVRIEADRLRSQGVDIIIVLSHCGIERDIEIARDGGPDVDVVVGGHSHTLLYNGAPIMNASAVHGGYPVVVQQSSGRQVLVVQASAFTRYVGDLVVEFDARGEIVAWTGNPVFLDESIAKDPEVEKDLQPWRKRVASEGRETIGYSQVTMKRRTCFQGECALGNYLADATANYYRSSSSSEAAIVLFNVGSFRADLNAGNITMADLRIILRNENTMDYAEMSGAALLEVLEHVVSLIITGQEFMTKYMIQFAGMQVVYDVSRPIGQRVAKADVLCITCNSAIYESIRPEQDYPVVTTSFLIAGGDGFTQFPEKMKNHRIGPKDSDLVHAYLEQTGPIKSDCLKGRIRIINHENSDLHQCKSEE